MSIPSHLVDERLALFRLTLVEGLGPVRLKALLSHFGSAERVLAASRSQLQQVDNIGEKSARAILESTTHEQAIETYERMRKLGVRLLFESDEDFPPGMREIPTCPLMLYVRGEIRASDRAAVAIVGSRKCSPYGLMMAGRLATQLASRGVTVVSGLARGIDGAAHRAALAAGGRTIAVLASGLANIYPPEHLDLAEQLVGQGALVTEAPLEGAPLAGLFPQRNRLITALSLGVVIVEASARSGTLSTFRHALEQNREVFAVPGRVGDPGSEGTNHLIQQGAYLVTNVDDILSQLGPVEIASPGSPSVDAVVATPPGLSPVELALWNALGTSPTELDTILEQTGLRASEASSALLMLEMRRLVRREPGNRYVRRT